METVAAESTMSNESKDSNDEQQLGTKYEQTLGTIRYLIMAGSRRYISDELLGEAIETQTAESDWDTVQILNDLSQIRDVSDEDMQSANQHVDCVGLCYGKLFLNLVVDLTMRLGAASDEILEAAGDEVMEQPED